MKYKSRAFTLIELLFVIAVVGVMCSFGLSLANKHVENSKVRKTAIQMQQILEAAIVYFEDNKNEWPSDAEHLKSKACSSASPNELCDYIPLEVNATNGIVNPWGTDYAWGKDGEIIAEKGHIVQHAFDVQVSTPTEAIAQKLKALLPNGVIKADENGKKVIVTARISERTPPPPKGGDMEVCGVGTANSSDWCVHYTAPDDTHNVPHVLLSAGAGFTKDIDPNLSITVKQIDSSSVVGDSGCSSGKRITPPKFSGNKYPAQQGGFGHLTASAVNYIVVCGKT